MLTHIRSEADLDAALKMLGEIEPRFGALVTEAGRPPLRRRPDGFAGLAATVVSQQLSTASAGAIWGRLAAAFDPMLPEAIMRARAVPAGAARPVGAENQGAQGDRPRRELAAISRSLRLRISRPMQPMPRSPRCTG